MTSVRAGCALMFPVGHKNEPHLVLVLTDPAGLSELVVVTAVVTETINTDKTVTLNVGDHEFIRWTSNVDYGWSRFIPAKKLLVALTKYGKAQPDMTEALLARVRAGLLESSRVPNDVADYCRPIFTEE